MVVTTMRNNHEELKEIRKEILSRNHSLVVWRPTSTVFAPTLPFQVLLQVVPIDSSLPIHPRLHRTIASPEERTPRTVG